MRFVQPMAGLLYISFRDFAIKMTGINNAFAYNYKNAISGVYPSFTIDYTQVVVSRGQLPNAVGPAVTSGAGSVLTFSWTDNSGVNTAKADDQAIFVAYCPSLKQAIYTTEGGMRSAFTGTLNVTAFSGLAVETFMGFISADGIKLPAAFLPVR